MNAIPPTYDVISIATLSALDCWVAWQTECREGETDPTKIPYVGLGRKAMANASRWISRKAAEELNTKLPKPFGTGGIGIEFATLDDGRALAGIDLDLCRDPGTGAIEDWALNVIERFDSYTEISPSGTGAKIFFTYAATDLPKFREAMNGAKFGKQFRRGRGKHPPAIELHLGNRYFAVTEQILSGMPTEFRQISTALLLDLIQVTGPAFAGKQTSTGTNKGELPPEYGNDNPELLTRINGACAFNLHLRKRWHGDWAGIKDTSGSGRAFALAVVLKHAGFSYDDTVAALLIHSQTREWTSTKGQTSGQRELHRIWERIADKAERATKPDADTELITEDSVALAFADAHRDTLRYCHHAGAWFCWDGNVWRREETKLAYAWARQMARETAAAADNFKAALAAGKASFAGGVERMAQTDRAFAVTNEIWDRDPFLLGTPSGTVDLRTGNLREARQSDHITKKTAVAPSETAHCPVWMEFLREITQKDEGLISFYQRWFGYCLTGDTREHALLFAYGPGGNGKGVLMTTVFGIMGAYATNAAMDSFVSTRGDKHTTDMAMLAGARLVITTEVDEGQAWAEAKIKALTGGDPITARFMRRDNFTFMPQFKLTVSGNHKPTLKNVDDAMRRRMNLAPFLFKPPTPDKTLAARLRVEWPGILRWMIDGCQEWQQFGMNPPQAVLDATKDYFDAQDFYGRWLQECCKLHPTLETKPSALLHSFQDWCRENGEEVTDNRRLRGLIEKTHGLRYVTTRGKQSVRGIGLNTPQQGTQPANDRRWGGA